MRVSWANTLVFLGIDNSIASNTPIHNIHKSFFIIYFGGGLDY